MPRQCVWVTWSTMDEDCTYFMHIFHQIAVFTENGKNSIQTKQNSIIFVWHLSCLSDINFQSVGQLSSNMSDFAKSVCHILKYATNPQNVRYDLSACIITFVSNKNFSTLVSNLRPMVFWCLSILPDLA